MLIFFDDAAHSQLFPLTFTRPACELRLGILTIREKWLHEWAKTDPEATAAYLTRDYLAEKYTLHTHTHNTLINGRVLPDNGLLLAINGLRESELLVQNNVIIAAKLSGDAVHSLACSEGLCWNNGLSQLPQTEYTDLLTQIDRPWQLFGYNDLALRQDYTRLTTGRTSQPLSTTNTLIGQDLFVEEGAVIEGAILNAKTGPIYVGKHAEIMEGAVVRGSLAMCEHSTLKMAAKIYGATTLGPHCKVGGEVNNAVLLGYSNKGHDGFLGNSVLGEWCNLGADTNNSNLKNNYAEVKVWDYDTQRFINTGLQFCGLIMGDHAKSGINPMFNTGTVVGVSANLFGAGFPRNYVPSFAWGGAASMTHFALPKAYEVAERVMARRGIAFTEIDQRILAKVMEMDGLR